MRVPRAGAAAASAADVIVPAAHGPAWQSLISGAELTTIPGAGHLAELEQPHAVADLISEFVANGCFAMLTA